MCSGFKFSEKIGLKIKNARRGRPDRSVSRKAQATSLSCAHFEVASKLRPLLRAPEVVAEGSSKIP